MINCAKESKEVLENNQTFAVGLGAILGIIVIIATVVIVLLPEEPETKEELQKTEPVKAEKLDTEDEILDFILNYQGTDDSGPTLEHTMSVLMEMSYPGEDILLSPATKVSLIATPDYGRDLDGRYWDVEGEIHTYRETAYFKWTVDTETKSVYAGDEVGRSVLDILDNFEE